MDALTALTAARVQCIILYGEYNELSNGDSEVSPETIIYLNTRSIVQLQRNMDNLRMRIDHLCKAKRAGMTICHQNVKKVKTNHYK